jgi:hypothetical protein
MKKMIEKNEIEPKDFTYNEDKTSMVVKNKALKVGLNKFTTKAFRTSISA